MAFNEIGLQKIKKEVGGLCRKRSPEELKDQLRFDYKIEKYDLIIYEIRPRWDNPAEITEMPIAKLTFVLSRNIWKLFWQRANGKWVRYKPKESSKELSDLTRAIESDVYGCFFQ